LSAGVSRFLLDGGSDDPADTEFLKARDAVEARSWSHPQEPTLELDCDFY